MNKRRSNRQGSETVTGVTKARQNQQQGQCKGRGRQQTERISKAGRVKRQAAKGQSRIGSPGKHTQGNRLEMSDGAKQDFAVSAWKCAAYMCVCK